MRDLSFSVLSLWLYHSDHLPSYEIHRRQTCGFRYQPVSLNFVFFGWALICRSSNALLICGALLSKVSVSPFWLCGFASSFKCRKGILIGVNPCPTWHTGSQADTFRFLGRRCPFIKWSMLIGLRRGAVAIADFQLSFLALSRFLLLLFLEVFDPRKQESPCSQA